MVRYDHPKLQSLFFYFSLHSFHVSRMNFPCPYHAHAFKHYKTVSFINPSRMNGPNPPTTRTRSRHCRLRRPEPVALEDCAKRRPSRWQWPIQPIVPLAPPPFVPPVAVQRRTTAITAMIIATTNPLCQFVVRIFLRKSTSKHKGITPKYVCSCPGTCPFIASI
jgi:hypothetical protein